MNAKDLRIGNLIKRKDLGTGEPRIETIIELRKDKVFTSGPVTVICDYDDINPIPLTEEWLRKFGFEHVHDDLFKLHITETVMIIANLNFLSQDLAICINNQRFYLGKKHIHQLQNLYYDLKQNELISKN